MRFTLTILLSLFTLASYSQVTYTWRYYLATADAAGFQNYYLVGMPSDSATNTNKRPVYMTLPGADEDGSGTSLANAHKYGWADSVYLGTRSGAITQSNGYTDSVVNPIYVSTHRASVTNQPARIIAQIKKFFVDYATYADYDQLHEGGISLGSKSLMRKLVDSVTTDFQNIGTTQWWTSPGGTDGTNITPNLSKINQYYAKGGRVAFTTGTDDADTYHYSALSSAAPGSVVGRDWTSGDGIGTTTHGGWSKVWVKAWDFLGNKSPRQWAAQFTKAPKAVAQSVINTTSSSVMLNGVSNGWYKTVAWTKISGTGTIASASSDTTSVTGIGVGTSVYRLTVTNTNDSRTATHDVTVNRTTTAPTANAGSDQSTTNTSVTLSGSGTAGSGASISSYAWTKISGTGGTITSASSASTGVTGLSVGTYVYRLTVTQNDSQTATDDVTITITSPPATGTATFTKKRGRKVIIKTN